MARYFNVSRFWVQTPAGAFAPLTFSAWYRPYTVTNGYQNLLGIEVDPHYMQVRIDNGTGYVTAECYDGVTVGSATMSVAATNNQWNHCAAVFHNTSTRSAYLNGSGVTVPGGVVTPNAATVKVGYLRQDIHNAHGELAQLAVWNVALTGDEIAALAKGVTPNLVRLQNLQMYWPLWGNDLPEPDYTQQRLHLAHFGTTAPKTRHPRIFNPWHTPETSVAVAAIEFSASASFGFSTFPTLSLPAPLLAASTFSIGSAATLTTSGGLVSAAGVRFASVGVLTALVPLRAAATVSFSADANVQGAAIAQYALWGAHASPTVGVLIHSE